MNRPISEPAARQNASMIQIECVALSTSMPKPLSSATCAPTEISICPAQMIIVIDRAIMPVVVADWRNSVVMLRQRKKLGLTDTAMIRVRMKDTR